MVGTINKSMAATSEACTPESAPSLARWPSPLDHVFGDARLRDLKPELEQFAVNARRTPKRIFDAHTPDQYAQLRVDLRSPSPASLGDSIPSSTRMRFSEHTGIVLLSFRTTFVIWRAIALAGYHEPSLLTNSSFSES
jgi:hypothetical protein